jgi:hypothetical protein
MWFQVYAVFSFFYLRIVYQRMHIFLGHCRNGQLSAVRFLTPYIHFSLVTSVSSFKVFLLKFYIYLGFDRC